MTKAVSVSIGFILMLATTVVSPAQTSPSDIAANEAVMRQADTIVLRQKLDQAKTASSRGDFVAAARLYEDAYSLVQQIGSGIDAETAQTMAGLAATHLQLARMAQQQNDFREADTQISRVLKVDPQNTDALALKKLNDRLIVQMRGKMPDDATLQQIPAIVNDKTQASTLVHDGQMLYEMGKFEEAETKLRQALKLDPDNQGAYYYLQLVKQAVYGREEHVHAVDSESSMVKVAKAWELPAPTVQLPVPNPYASSTSIHTGSGREAIEDKLNLIHLDSVFYDGLPLSEVVRNLSEQTKLRDPDKKGINFFINPNQDNSVSTVATPGQFGNAPFGAPQAAAQIDPATGLPIAAGANGGGEQVDVNSIVIKINPALNDVRLADALDAIVQVADHPIKYSVEDYAIVFSAKGPNQPEYFNRTFKVDPNTFYQGLESVGALSFGSVSSTGSGSGSGGGGGGGSGGGSGSGSGNNGGAVLPVVNVAPGGASLRTSGNGSGGGGGGGGGGGQTGNGGLTYITVTNGTVDVSVAARNFFTTLGVDLSPPKSVFFNDRLGLLFVRATMQDLDTIESAIQALNQVAPQVHIKARFIQVDQTDNTALGFDWYLGQFNAVGTSSHPTITASGGSESSQGVPVNAANPAGIFPGGAVAGAVNQVAALSSDQSVFSPFNANNANPVPINQANLPAVPALATITGILTDPNFRVVLRALQQRGGAEDLAEPEVTTTSGRQTEMRATTVIQVVTGFSFTAGASAVSTTGTTTP